METPKTSERNTASRLLILIELGVGKTYLNWLLDVAGSKRDLGIHNNHYKTALSVANQIQAMCDTVEEDLRNWNPDPAVRREFYNALTAVRHLALPKSFDNPFGSLKQADAALLKMLALQLAPDPTFPKECLTELRSLIGEFRKIIKENELSPVLRKCLLEIVRHLEEAISLYEVYGQEDFTQAYKRVMADAIVISHMNDPAVTEEITQTGSHKLVTRMMKVLDKMVTKFPGYERLGTTIIKMLEAGA